MFIKEFFEIENFVFLDFFYFGKRCFIVFIDEVDKVFCDFFNDIFNELEYLYFWVWELGNIKIEVNFKL